jgi:hypothetical protein
VNKLKRAWTSETLGQHYKRERKDTTTTQGTNTISLSVFVDIHYSNNIDTSTEERIYFRIYNAIVQMRGLPLRAHLASIISFHLVEMK